MNIYQLNATFILFWITIGCTSIKGSYRHLILVDSNRLGSPNNVFCQVLGLCKWPLTRAIFTLTRWQWQSSNLFLLVIQGDTRTFELTNWLNKVRTLLWCCFLTQFRPETIRNCFLYLAHFWDLIIGFRVGFLQLHLTCSTFSTFVCDLGRCIWDARAKRTFGSFS